MLGVANAWMFEPCGSLSLQPGLIGRFGQCRAENFEELRFRFK